jgi:hypothetical protein
VLTDRDGQETAGSNFREPETSFGSIQAWSFCLIWICFAVRRVVRIAERRRAGRQMEHLSAICAVRPIRDPVFVRVVGVVAADVSSVFKKYKRTE